MRIIVCLKSVPDPKHWNKLKLDPETKTLIREGIPSTINPLDKNALEEALRLNEKQGGEVIVISMAPLEMIPVLQEALAMGANRAVLLSDRAFSGSDTLGTAYVLAEAIKAIGNFDLILCGNETIDGGTAQVSAQISEFLDVPNLMFVSQIEYSPGLPFKVRSQIELGYRVVEIAPPMVLSVVKEINEPRYVTMMNILAAEEKEIQVWTSEDLNLTEPCVGLADSPTQMADLFIPERGRNAEMLDQDAEIQAKELADRLHRLGFC
ncbi:MAG: electron transfer flavoprotein subunit beta/FixA family protein [Deltaproteobacteria bacterium]|nr:electron transfer flavoprotein subunit beta/FixA family protein [Deltaproteobacteria bacterium]